jgi:dTDP-4-amino-4,6-dideoxygalactose transaminase
MSDASVEIPFFSFDLAPLELKQKWVSRISKVIEKGQFIFGDEVREFEKSWAFKNGNKYAVGVSNGQDALILALRAIGVGKNDKVIVPAHSFIATHNAIVALGAVPYSVDVNQQGLISASDLHNLDFVPKALIVVHMHGQMCEMIDIMTWAKENDIAVIEDCSQAHFAKFEGKNSGTFGDVGIFSLYPTKNLGALGDAGILVTDSNQIFQKVSSLANYGSSKDDKYEHKEFGLNNRLDEIQAAVLNVNLPLLEDWNNRRREIADLYIEELTSLPYKIMQSQSRNNVWHHFCILYENRDQLRTQLAEKGIRTEIHYPNLAATESERILGQNQKTYPNAMFISRSVLSLPISPWHTDNQILSVIDALKDLA